MLVAEHAERAKLRLNCLGSATTATARKPITRRSAGRNLARRDPESELLLDLAANCVGVMPADADRAGAGPVAEPIPST
jgi:hypothetical protein